MKVHIKMFIVSVLTISCFLTACSTQGNKENKATIGVVIGKFDDTWRTSVRNEIYKMAGDKVQVDIWSANDSQKTEDDKIDLLISRKVNALVVNLVDIKSAAQIMDKAKKANIPIVFFNTEPSAEDFKKWDKAYFVGSKGEQSGSLQAQILVNYFKNNPTSDGIIRYVMLEGPEGHQDAISRTNASVEGLVNAGFKVEKVASEVAEWDRSKAQQKMQIVLDSQAKFDCVIANNDDMALGAVDGLKSKGYFSNGKYIPVVGVDATGSALNAIDANTMLGTVLNDAENQGKAIFNLTNLLANGQVPNKNNYTYPITDDKHVWIDYKIITKENIDEVK